LDYQLLRALLINITALSALKVNWVRGVNLPSVCQREEWLEKS